MFAGPGFFPAFPKPSLAKVPTLTATKWHLPALVQCLSEKLRDYRLLKKLGEGTFGTVWLAETTLNGDDRALVAVKAICRSNSVVSIDAIQQEKQLLQSLGDSNPGVGYFPQLIESFSDGNNFYIVQEYISGGTLRDEMDRSSEGRLPLSRAKFIMAQLLTIVQAMHKVGVVHRDIKPDNIMFDAAGNVVLTDLGLAGDLSKFSGSTANNVCSSPLFRQTRRRCGTPGYMAPEVMYKVEYQFSADIYSLGVVFYEMVTGAHPFPYFDASQMLDAMMEYKFTVPLGVLPRVIMDLMIGLLSFNPLTRMDLAQVMHHAFFADIDWTLVATRKYELPLRWAPPLVPVDRTSAIDRTVLIDQKVAGLAGAQWRQTIHDRAFLTPRRAPAVKRPVPRPVPHRAQCYMRRALLGALGFAFVRRAAVFAGIPIPYPDQSDEPVVFKFHMAQKKKDVRKPDVPEEVEIVDVEMVDVSDLYQVESVKDSNANLVAEAHHAKDTDERDIVEQVNMHGIQPVVNSIAVPSRTQAINVPRRPPPIAIPSVRYPTSECGRASGLSVFDVSIGQLDEILLSPPPGLAPRRVLAFENPAPLPSPPGSAFLSALIPNTERPSSQETLPISPGPVTPTSETFNAEIQNIQLAKAVE